MLERNYRDCHPSEMDRWIYLRISPGVGSSESAQTQRDCLQRLDGLSRSGGTGKHSRQEPGGHFVGSLLYSKLLVLFITEPIINTAALLKLGPLYPS